MQLSYQPKNLTRPWVAATDDEDFEVEATSVESALAELVRVLEDSISYRKRVEQDMR